MESVVKMSETSLSTDTSNAKHCEVSVTNPIKSLLESYGDNEGWYNPLKLLPYFDDTILFYIVGARRIGKTDLFLRLACDLWLQYNRKTLWIRDHDKHFQDEIGRAHV